MSGTISPKGTGMQLQFPPDHPLIIARTQVALPKGAFIRALPFLKGSHQVRPSFLQVALGP